MSINDGYRELVGKTALGSDGKRLGKVLDCGEALFLVERGALFHLDYLVPYSEVEHVEGAKVILRRHASYYRQQRQPNLTEGPSALNSASSGFLGPMAAQA